MISAKSTKTFRLDWIECSEICPHFKVHIGCMSSVKNNKANMFCIDRYAPKLPFTINEKRFWFNQFHISVNCWLFAWSSRRRQVMRSCQMPFRSMTICVNKLFHAQPIENRQSAMSSLSLSAQWAQNPNQNQTKREKKRNERFSFMDSNRISGKKWMKKTANERYTIFASGNLWFCTNSRLFCTGRVPSLHPATPLFLLQFCVVFLLLGIKQNICICLINPKPNNNNKIQNSICIFSVCSVRAHVHSCQKQAAARHSRWVLHVCLDTNAVRRENLSVCWCVCIRHIRWTWHMCEATPFVFFYFRYALHTSTWLLLNLFFSFLN